MISNFLHFCKNYLNHSSLRNKFLSVDVNFSTTIHMFIISLGLDTFIRTNPSTRATVFSSYHTHYYIHRALLYKMCECMYVCALTNTHVFVYFTDTTVCICINEWMDVDVGVGVCVHAYMRVHMRCCRFCIRKCSFVWIRRNVNTFQAYHVTRSCTQPWRGKLGRLPFDQNLHEREAANNFVRCAHCKHLSKHLSKRVLNEIWQLGRDSGRGRS